MKKIIYSLFILILISCGGAGEESSEIVYKELKRESDPKELVANEIGGELILSYIHDIYFYDPYIVLHADDSKSFFHMFDKESGELVVSGGRKGRSGTELPEYIFGVTLVGNKISAATQMNQVKVYNIDEIIAGGSDGYITTIKQDTKEISPRLMFPLEGDKRLFVKGSALLREGDKVERFAIKDGDSTMFEYSSTIPIAEEDIEKNFAFWSTFAANELSPNGKKMAVATRYGAILEVFDIDVKDNTIEKVATNAIYKPDYTYDKKDFGGGRMALSMGPNDNSYIGFADICTTDKYIYALYTGSIFNDKDRDNEPTPNLTVFNWKGKYLTEFKLDKKLNNITISSNGEMLYGVAIDEEGVCTLVSYNLKDLI